jgi:hypothetical protein
MKKKEHFLKIYNESKKNSKLYTDYKAESEQSSKMPDYSFDSKLSNYDKNKNNNKNKINSNNVGFFSGKSMPVLEEKNKLDKININNRKNKFSNKNVPGVRIYNQHIEHIKKKEEKIKKMKEEEEKLKKKELKFKPQINKYSNTNTNYCYTGKIEDKLIAYGNKYKQNRSNKKKENNIVIKEEHRPKLTKETEILGKIKRKNREKNLRNHVIFINPDYLIEPIRRSQTIKNSKKENNLNFSFSKVNLVNSLEKCKSSENLTKRYYKTYYNPLHPVERKTTKILGRKIPLPQLTPDKNLYDYLYIEAKLLKEKRDIDIMKDMAKRCPFKPNLSKSMDRYKKNKKYKNKKEKRKNVFERLFMAQNIRQKICKTPDSKKYRGKNSLIDSKTGQQLFKPKITRGPRNPHRRDLSYENNELNHKNKENNELKEDLTNKLKQEKKKKYLEKMNKIIVDAKKLKYVELFNRLDSDKDGLISNKKIKLSFLDNKKLIALTPIFKELQYDGVEMDLNVFCQKVDNIEEFKYITESEIKNKER